MIVPFGSAYLTIGGKRIEIGSFSYSVERIEPTRPAFESFGGTYEATATVRMYRAEFDRFMRALDRAWLDRLARETLESDASHARQLAALYELRRLEGERLAARTETRPPAALPRRLAAPWARSAATWATSPVRRRAPRRANARVPRRARRRVARIREVAGIDSPPLAL